MMDETFLDCENPVCFEGNFGHIRIQIRKLVLLEAIADKAIDSLDEYTVYCRLYLDIRDFA